MEEGKYIIPQASNLISQDKDRQIKYNNEKKHKQHIYNI